MDNVSKDLTQFLQRWRAGDERSLDLMLPEIINQLHSIAAKYLRRENPGHTLQATALVNEAYLQLIKCDVSWQDRAHFFAIAATQMRRILVDHARSKGRFKRGGDVQHQSFSDTIASSEATVDEFVMIEELLSQMEAFDQRAAKIFELKFYGGLTVSEIVEVQGLSSATVNRELRVAKAWILKELGKS